MTAAQEEEVNKARAERERRRKWKMVGIGMTAIVATLCAVAIAIAAVPPSVYHDDNRLLPDPLTQSARPWRIFAGHFILPNDEAPGDTPHLPSLQSRPFDGAVLVAENGFILRIDSVETLAAAHPQLPVIDLASAAAPHSTIIPGFIESHLHLLRTGTFLGLVDCSISKTNGVMSVCLEGLRARTAALPAGDGDDDSQWVMGWGYDASLTQRRCDSCPLEERLPLTKEDLDEVTGQYPSCVYAQSLHVLYCNSRALAVAGVDASLDVVGLDKDADGQPTGILYEGQAMDLVRPFWPEQAPEETLKQLRDAFWYLSSQGYTSAADAFYSLDDAFLLRYVGHGNLPIRVNLYTNGMYGPQGFRYLQSVYQQHYDAQQLNSYLNVRGIKLFVDGSIQEKTGFLLQPYEGTVDYTGEPYSYPRQQIKAAIEAAQAGGFQAITHANGDAAIARLLDIFCEVIFPQQYAQLGYCPPNLTLDSVTTPPLVRPRIEHAQMSSEQQLDLMARLGITPSFFANHVHAYGDVHPTIIGPTRAARISPLASALRRNLRFSLQCDSPVTKPDPLLTLYTVITRQTRAGAILGPDQAVSPAQALQGYTLNNALACQEETIKGSIQVGKLADFAMLSVSPLTLEPASLLNTQILATVIGGRVVCHGPRTSTLMPSQCDFWSQEECPACQHWIRVPIP